MTRKDGSKGLKDRNDGDGLGVLFIYRKFQANQSASH